MEVVFRVAYGLLVPNTICRGSPQGGNAEEVPAEDALRVYGGCRDFEKVRRWVDINYSCTT